jgi:hypothetical protein
MKKKKPTRPLTFSKSTLRRLTGDVLSGVVGGEVVEADKATIDAPFIRRTRS